MQVTNKCILPVLGSMSTRLLIAFGITEAVRKLEELQGVTHPEWEAERMTDETLNEMKVWIDTETT